MLGIVNNKKYFVSFMVLLLSSFAVNFCNQIYQCAFFFTLVMSTSWLISKDYGQKSAFVTLFLALFISGSLTINFNYTIHGKIYNGIVVASLVSAFVSFVVASLIFNRKSNYKALPVLITAAILDGAIMSSYFSNKIALENVSVILAQELFFKAIYSGLALMVINSMQHNHNSEEVITN